MTKINTNTAPATKKPTLTHKTPVATTQAEAQKGLRTTTGTRAGWPSMK